ncbi:uncharacterized protein A1O5_08482 [Cladophialophora psammophila CBS 110553]|uniref:Ig-like domain-containing protein n=1 Tax=Cladophialophora psammophila CBS 110553 TaxID=1182543 RepID=W9WL87_9EURO|nr:uncharacterized protein A1O5_08482 [Cladophialophora psammophila CBS 110553]EXJ68688.1 hypothetical protein A1O5_08482 [Cladophialophora psammophila CBS 110553]
MLWGMPLLLTLGQSSDIEAGSLSDNAARVVPVAPLTGPGVSTLTDPNTVSSPVTSSFAGSFSSAPTIADGWWSSFWSSVAAGSTSWDGDGFGTTDIVLTLYSTDSTTTDSAGMVSSQPLTTVTGTLSASVTSSTFVAHGSESLISSGPIVVPASKSMSPDTSAVVDSLSSDKTTTTTLTTRVKTTLYVTNVTTAPRLSATPATSMRSWSDWTLSRSWPAWLNSTASRSASRSISTAHSTTADSLSTASSATPESLPEVTVTVYVTPLLPTSPSTTTLTVTVLATSTRTTLVSLTTGSDVALTSGLMTISPISPHTSAVSVASIHTPSSTSLPVRNATISPNVEPTLSLRLPGGVFLSTETNGVVYSYSGYTSANTTHYVSLLAPIITTCVPTTTVTYYNAQGSPTQTILQCGTGIGPDVTPGFGIASLDNTATPHSTSTLSISPPTASPLPTAPAASPLSPENPPPTRVTASLDSPLACSLGFGNPTPPGRTLTPAITNHAHGTVASSETPSPSRLWQDGSGLESAGSVSSRTSASKRDRDQDDRPQRTRAANRTFLRSSEAVGGQRPSTTLITVPRSS